MPELLTEWLRALADRCEPNMPASLQVIFEARDAMRGAADELERLERKAHPEHLAAQPRQTFLATTITGGGAHIVAPAGHLFAAIVLPADEARVFVGDARLHELGAELAGDGGVPVPMPATRGVVAYYRDGEALPAPGSFAFVGPALAVWRVHRATPEPEPEAAGEALAVHRDGDGTERRPVFLELEAVDAHDVPVATRLVETVPLPVHEVSTAGQAIA